MVSTIITPIHSALDDVELLVNARDTSRSHIEVFKILRFRLRNLKTFVLSARKLGSDGNLGSFLLWMEETVCRKAEEIHAHSLDLSNGIATLLHMNIATGFLEDIQSLEQEIDEWFLSILDNAQPQSISLTRDEVFELLTSIFKTLQDFHSLRSRIPRAEIVAAMADLRDQMAFLKTLFRFATQRSIEVEPREDLLAHAEDVAINAAHLCFTCRFDNFDEESSGGMRLKISYLLQKIKPIDPRVYEIYTQALCCSDQSLPTRDMDDDDALLAIKDFLDSLISNFWEMLRLNTDRVVSLKVQLQELYEGLRSLRTTLEQQPNNFAHFKEEIGAAVCDVGFLLCSFYQTIELDLGRLTKLLATMENILALVGERDSQVQRFNFPRTSELGFVDFLIEKLTELMTSCEVEPTAKSRVQTIQEGLVYLRPFLGWIVELHNKHKELPSLWDRFFEVAYRVECLVDHQMAGDLPNSFSTSFDSNIEDLENIKEDVLRIYHIKRPQIEAEATARTYSHVSSQRNPSITNEVVGFQRETESIRDRLTRGSSQLQVIAIVGMAGIGKTTLASKIYNDPSLLYYFWARAWCPISQVVDKKKVLLELLNQINPDTSSEMTDEKSLAEKLWQSLKGKRYLIVLDDLWDIEVWNSLELAFPNETYKSRIILTSRHHEVVPLRVLSDKEPVSLQPLNTGESFRLLGMKLFPEIGWPGEFQALGWQIAENCKGLPLTVVLVAGMLATIRPERWGEILDDLRSHIETGAEHTLEFSYKHLPYHLRPCFLYFAAFPKDQEVSVRRLLRLWIAEGFVRKADGKSLEDVAKDYLMALNNRSLILIAKQRSGGGLKAFLIHDLLRDFCLRKVGNEHFFYFLKGSDNSLDLSVQRNLRRLCIYSELEHFKQSKLFCPRARSLLLNSSIETPRANGAEQLLDISIVIHFFKRLRVLDLEQFDLGNVFPSEMGLLSQLAFLAVRGNMRHIPSSIGNLSNLETLIVDPGRNILSLPESLWNLQRLHYVLIRSSHNFGGGSLPIQNLDSSAVLHELERFSGALIPSWGSMERLMRKFPKIRKLKCKLFQYRNDTEHLDWIMVPDLLSHLESLHLSRHRGLPFHSMFEFSFPANLKKLTLEGFYLSKKNISIIGKLPNLEILKLFRISFEGGETWQMKEREFLKLRILELSYLGLVKWEAGDNELVSFQKLVLNNCRLLVEMPDCLKFIATLEMIEVSHCSNVVENLVMEIKGEQEKGGHSGLEIIIRSLK